MSNRLICLNASITLSKKFSTLSHVNAKYNYSLQSVLTLLLPNRNVMTKFEWPEEKSLQEMTIQQFNLKLMSNQSTCLNASITLSKLPIMMQTQIQSTNMRWGGTTLKSLQPCLVPILNITIPHYWLSHYNWYEARVGGPKYYAVNLISRLFLYLFYIRWAPSPSTTTQTHNKHRHHGGGAACLSSGIDLMIPCRPRGGWPCTYIVQGCYWRI